MDNGIKFSGKLIFNKVSFTRIMPGVACRIVEKYGWTWVSYCGYDVARDEKGGGLVFCDARGTFAATSLLDCDADELFI